MDAILASGLNNNGEGDTDKITNQVETKKIGAEDHKLMKEDVSKLQIYEENSHNETICDSDLNLKERIAKCKKIIDSLKLELNEEKAKLEESKSSVIPLTDPSPICSNDFLTGYSASSIKLECDTAPKSDTNYLYRCNADTNLLCDDSLMEYEQQLQRYQDTLTMAHAEKKNAIRKQMLAKAYKLKLMEVENQCNIELLRVKQSLQCLEPLQMIVNKWKENETDSTYDFNNYEPIPGYPEINTTSSHNENIFTDDEKSEFVAFNEET